MAAPVRDSAWLEWIVSLMGGTSRQRRAATFPPDYYWCLLDELPLHLIPAGSLPSAAPDRRQEFVLNPLARILPGGQIPTELSAHSAVLERFAVQGTIAWVPRSGSDSFLPFWLTSRLEEALTDVTLEGGLSSRVRNEELSILIAVELLRAEESAERDREHWHEMITSAAEMFRERDYAPMRNLIHPFHVAALRRYFRYMIRRGMFCLGDEQSARRYGVHNDSVAQFFHQHLTKTISLVVGETVKPSYVYSACYLSGAELTKHIDREQCEFSISLCLDFTPEPEKETPWPIRLDTPHGPVSIYQALGDGLVYRGTRVPHYRDVLAKGRTSTSIFFHYVREDFAGSLD
jgi:hypothetical protein